MKQSLDHLPDDGKIIIDWVLTSILKGCHPEKVVLFGSRATDKWLSDMQAAQISLSPYIGDYDFFIVAKPGEKIPEDAVISGIGDNYKTLSENIITILSHDIIYLNNQLSKGQFFFSEIITEGILLYDAGTIELAAVGPTNWEETVLQAEQDLNIWLDDAQSFFSGAKFFLNESKLRISLFCLHQAAESTYSALVLIHRGYKSKTHNLRLLYKKTKSISEKLAAVFSFSSESDWHLLELLRRGYIEARYDKEFVVTGEQLTILQEKISRLITIAESICRAKLELLKKNL